MAPSFAEHLIAIGGGAGRLIAERDWGPTPLGQIDSWPQPFRTVVSLLLTSPVPMVLLWGDEGVMVYNDPYSAFAGGRHPELLGRNVCEGWPEVAALNDHIMRSVLAGGALSYKDQELTLNRHGQPEQVWVNLDCSPVIGEDGKPAGVLVVVAETTERVVAEARVRDSEARYRQIVEGAEDFAIATVDESGTITSWNRGAVRVTGFEDGDIIGRSGDIIFTPEDRAAGVPDHELNRAMSDGRSLNERWHMRKDGSRFWGSGLTMRLDQPGRGYLKIFRDRTAEHEAEAQFRALQAALASEVEALGRLQEVSTRLIGDGEPKALYDAILTAATDLMGSECASIQMLDDAGDLQLLAHRGYDPRSAEYWSTVRATSGSTCGIALKTGERVVVPDVEDSGLPPDSGDLKSYRWTGMRAVQTTPLLSRSGKPLGMLSTHWKRPLTPAPRDLKLFDVLARQAADAIERTMAQAELRESEARQAFLLSLADTMRALKSPVEIASVAAQQLGQRFGLSRVFYAEFFGSLMKVERDHTDGVESLVGEHDLDAFGPELLRAYHEAPIVKIDDVRTDARLSEQARTGLLARQVQAYFDVILFEDQQWVSMLALQSATPRAWSASEERLFREVGERVKAGIERARAEDRLRELNETLERRVDEALAQKKLLADLVEGTDAFVQVVDFDYRWLAINRSAADEFERIYGVRPNVGDSMLDLLAEQPDHQAAVRAVWGRALAGEEFTEMGEFGDPSRDRRCYEMKYNTLRRNDGERIGAYQFVYDVTRRVDEQRRLAETEEALRQSQKMESMGQLTGGVAHDFNNLLTPIVGSLDMLQRKGIGNERERRLIAGAAQSAERAKTLVQRLLAFARRQPLQAVAVDIAKLVEGISDLVTSTTGPRIEVVVQVDRDLPAASADPNQLEMALLNLAVNARDAMPGGGTLRIAATTETVSPGHRSGLRSGTYVKLSVADTGIGMDEATLARAVEPFFSTKGIGKGTGLGLSMVHGLASQLGGALTIQSRPKFGTNIELWLPQSAATPTRSEQLGEASVTTTTRGVALLVDDEDLVRMSTADMLGELGYAVIEAASAEEAMRIIETGERFDVLLTDHLMPGISGTDLARSIRWARPEVPVLLVSGYAESEGVDPDLPRLTKPFRRDELEHSLAQLPNAS